MEADDRALARRLAHDAPGAFADLYDRHGGAVYRFLLRWTGRVESAEDLVQAVFLRLYRYRARLAGVENLRAYVLRVARNEALRRRGEPGTEAHDVDTIAVADDAPDRDEQEEIRQAVARLSPERREVVSLKIWEGLTFAEIGEVLDVSPNTVASRYRYALADLRRVLEGCHERP